MIAETDPGKVFINYTAHLTIGRKRYTITGNSFQGPEVFGRRAMTSLFFHTRKDLDKIKLVKVEKTK